MFTLGSPETEPTGIPLQSKQGGYNAHEVNRNCGICGACEPSQIPQKAQ